jgi:hypothetical protein
MERRTVVMIIQEEMFRTQEKEIWKKVEGFDGRYEVSNFGKVRSYFKNKLHFLIPCKHPNGYLHVDLRMKGLGNRISIHRLVAKLFILNPENKPCVNHKNGIKTDNAVENLEWATYSENQQHCYNTGLRPITLGENSPNAKLTGSDVKKIKKLIDDGVESKKIALLFNVHPSNISYIKCNKTWTHI